MKQTLLISAIVIIALVYSLNRAVINNTKSEFRVGVSAPLTGDLAEFGQAVRNGIQLAIAENPAEFKNLEFLYEDNQYHPAAAVSAYTSLRNQHKVDLIFDWGEPTLGAIAPIAEKNKMPVIGMSLDPQPAINKKYIIRSINHAAQFGRKTLQYIRKQRYKKIAVISTEDPFTNSMVEGLQKHLAADESIKVVATLQPGDMDFRTTVLRLKRYQPEIVAVYLLPGQVSAFYRQAGVMKYQFPSVGTDVFESETEITQAKGFMEGAVFPILDVGEDFAANYKAEFGNDLHLTFAYNAFFVAKIAARSAASLAKDANWSSSDVLAAVLSSANSQQSFSLNNHPDAGRYLKFPIAMHQVRGGKLVKLN